MSNVAFPTARRTSDRLDFLISTAEDWSDQLPQLLEWDGTPLDLDGKSLTLTIRPVFDHSIMIAALSSPDAIVLDDAAGGWARIVQPQSAVATLPSGTWDCFLTLQDGSHRREMTHGTITIVERRLSA